MTTWREVWERKGIATREHLDLASLLERDGFDSGSGKIDVGVWRRYVDWVMECVGVTGGAVLEIGCGAGAFLYVLTERGWQVTGTDYSSGLIALAQAAVPTGSFLVQEAQVVGALGEQFDLTLANSVFQYFPDLQYAERVVRGMLHVAVNTVAILDIYDRTQQEAMEALRRGDLGDAAYEAKYWGLPHHYYDRQWFLDVGEQLGWQVSVFDQPDWLCDVSTCRFSVVMKK